MAGTLLRLRAAVQPHHGRPGARPGRAVEPAGELQAVVGRRSKRCGATPASSVPGRRCPAERVQRPGRRVEPHAGGCPGPWAVRQGGCRRRRRRRRRAPRRARRRPAARRWRSRAGSARCARRRRSTAARRAAVRRSARRAPARRPVAGEPVGGCAGRAGRPGPARRARRASVRASTSCRPGRTRPGRCCPPVSGNTAAAPGGHVAQLEPAGAARAAAQQRPPASGVTSSRESRSPSASDPPVPGARVDQQGRRGRRSRSPPAARRRAASRPARRCRRPNPATWCSRGAVRADQPQLGAGRAAGGDHAGQPLAVRGPAHREDRLVARPAARRAQPASTWLTQTPGGRCGRRRTPRGGRRGTAPGRSPLGGHRRRHRPVRSRVGRRRVVRGGSNPYAHLDPLSLQPHLQQRRAATAGSSPSVVAERSGRPAARPRSPAGTGPARGPAGAVQRVPDVVQQRALEVPDRRAPGSSPSCGRSPRPGRCPGSPPSARPCRPGPASARAGRRRPARPTRGRGTAPAPPAPRPSSCCRPA